MRKLEKYSVFSKLLPSIFNLYIKLIFLFFIFYLFFSTEIYAQKTEIKLDTNSILLGDQIKLSLKINIPKDAKVTFPQIADTITQHIEVLNIGKIDTLTEGQNNTVTLSQNITITSFDSGYFAIPPFIFIYELGKDTTKYFAETEALLLEVKKVATDEKEDIKDIKDIFGAPLTFREILPYILAFIALVIVVIIAIWLWKKFRKNEPLVLIKKTEIPPHIEALKAFEDLKKRKLWENNFVKEYYSELTDILRRYIERGLSINAMELTTVETMDAIEKSNINKNNVLILKQVLELSDLVKFAKYTPIPPDHESCFNLSVDFVKNTMFVGSDNQKEKDNHDESVIINDSTINEKKSDL